jgi:hypothetical protein
MIKKINIYWLIIVLIIAIQLIVPPNIGKIYYYFIILVIVFFINGGYNLIDLRSKNVKNQTDNLSFRSIKNPDFSLFTSLMNDIAVATFIYFFYINVIVMSNAIDDPSGSKIYECEYQSKSYFTTYSEAEVLHFWEFATIVLIPSSIVIRIINGLRKNNMP